MAAKPQRRALWAVESCRISLSGEPAYRETHATSSPEAEERARELFRRGRAGEDVADEAQALSLAEGNEEQAGHVAATVAPSTKRARRLRGARITDNAAGLAYECVAERRYGAPVLTYLAVIPMHGGVIDRDSRDAIPYDDLARVTIEHVEAAKPLTVARAPKQHTWPGHEAVADAARQAQAAAGSPRLYLASTYQVSEFTADKWLRKARDAGALPERKPGRPRRTTRKGNS